MGDIRPVDLPEKDAPLRADVSLLGHLLGEMLVDQHGDELLRSVEEVRLASIRQAEGGDPAELEAVLSGLDDDRTLEVIQAFTAYLRAANLAEKVHRVRRRRVHQRDGDTRQRGGLEDVLYQLHSANISQEKLARGIARLRLQPVFTAHPTEATRRTLQEKEYDIILRLVERLNPEITPAEDRLAMARIRAALTSAWQTRLAPSERPSVADELENILFYLTDILYRIVPVFYDVLSSACEKEYAQVPDRALAKTLLRFGSWVGGDMDGNPNVTSQTILATLARQRTVIIRRYIPEVNRLARYLSQTLGIVEVADDVLIRLERYRNQMPEVARGTPDRHNDMPYRCLLRFVAARLSATADDLDHGYSSCDEFLDDIEAIHNSLKANRGEKAGLFGVDRLLRRIRTFGFHLATLDVRQDALLHRRVIGELLGCSDWNDRDPGNRASVLSHLLSQADLPEYNEQDAHSDETHETIAVFNAISHARKEYGQSAIGLFITSMTQGADDVLTVLALAEIANPHTGSASRLDIAPLLETVNDLDAGPDILKQLLADPVYRKHLAGLENRQVIMVGYSDSSKDSGIVSSRWALYQAQKKLISLGEEQGIQVAFFHGRGGTVSRGGGDLVKGIEGSPPDSIRGFLRVTEQGEVINRKFGVRSLALRNLELEAGATLKHSLGVDVKPISEPHEEMLTFLATHARKVFRGMVYQNPDFPKYFRAATPLDVIERLNIGSRPASRRSGEGIENLRAIPWVFSWAQVRMGFPGVYGLGSALQALIERFGLDASRALLNQNVFVQAMISDAEMVLGKSVVPLGQAYSQLADPSLAYIHEEIVREFDLAESCILQLKNLQSLLEDQPVLKRNIRLRNPYVQPLHLLQIDLLRQWRAGDRQDEHVLEALKATVNGIALGIQNTG